MIGFFLLFPGPFSLPWDGCWLHGQGLTKATALGKQDKNWSFHNPRPFLPVFEGTFPVLGGAEEGETAAQLPYPLALVPSSAFPGAASSQGFLRESISGQTAVKPITVASLAKRMLLRALASTHTPLPSLSVGLGARRAEPGAPGIKGISPWGRGKERMQV